MIKIILLYNFFYQLLTVLSILFIILIILTILGILIAHDKRGIHFKKRESYSAAVLPLIQNVIFLDSTSNLQEQIDHLLPFYEKWLIIKQHRQWLIEDLMEAKKDLSGDAAFNLYVLYDHLALHNESLMKLNSHIWHKTVKGIQELYKMNSKKHIEKIRSFSHHPNDFIRSEAQIGLTNLAGFKGLDFLNTLQSPISPWNQMRIINALAAIPYDHFISIDHWLNSPNPSVRMLALKITKIYHLFSAHDQVVTCLSDKDEEIISMALECLQEIYNDQTEDVILKYYPSCKVDSLKIKALNTLGAIISKGSKTLLLKELCNKNDLIVLASSRSLITSGQANMAFLHEYHADGQKINPLIIEHLKFTLGL